MSEVKIIKGINYHKCYPCIICSKDRREDCNGIYNEIYDSKGVVHYRFVSKKSEIFIEYVRLKAMGDFNLSLREVKCHLFVRTECHNCNWNFLKLNANPCKTCEKNPIKED